MNSKKLQKWAVSAAGLALLAWSAGAQADERVKAVLDCMDANLPSSLRVQDIELLAIHADSPDATTLRGKVYVQREKNEAGSSRVRASLRIASPDYLKGAAYLVRQSESKGQDGMYVYLPSVKRVRRISGEFSDGQMLGTNISYYDFKQMQHAVSDADVAREEDTTLLERPVHVLAYKPTAEAGTRYDLVRTWVDRESCVVLKADFIEQGKLRKQMTAETSALKRVDNYWYLSALRFDDLKDKSYTDVRIFVPRSGGPDLPARLFDPGTFYLGN